MFIETLKKYPVTAILALGNILVFLLSEVTGSSQNVPHMLQMGASYPPYILEGGQWYRLFTCMFLHFGMEHLVSNLLSLVVLGQRMEPILGGISMLAIYLLGGLFGNMLSLWQAAADLHPAVSAGASGAVFALMGATVYVLIRHKGRAADLTTRQVLIMAGLSLYLGFSRQGVDNMAHVGGFAGGFLLCVLLYHPQKNR